MNIFRPWRGVIAVALGGCVCVLSARAQQAGDPTAGAEQALLTPPRVIAVEPAAGTPDVDAGLTSIRVTFDRPMQTERAWSWMILRPHGVYPGVRGAEPVFDEEGRTCTLPVSLGPGVVYAVGINSPRHTGFKAGDGTVALNFGWAFATGGHELADMPPRVVATVPEAGAVDVDPGLREISVTFDRPMQDGTWSWVRQPGCGEFPGSGEPRFEEQGLTCTLPVSLDAGKLYAVSINSYRHTGFMSRNERAALPFAWAFRTRGQEGADSQAGDGVYVPRATTPEGLYREGSKLSAEGRHDDAIAAWRALIERFPGHNRAGCTAVYMGQLQLRLKAYEDAEASLKLAAGHFAEHKYGNGVQVGSYATFYLVHLYCETQRYAEAGETLRTLVEKYPYASGHRMGDALMSLRAKTWFHEKLTSNGVDVTFLDELISAQKKPENFDTLTPRQLEAMAYTLKDEGDIETSALAFKRILRDFDSASYTTYALTYAFDVQMRARDLDAACLAAQLMIEQCPTGRAGKAGPLAGVGHFSLGQVQVEREQYEEAGKAFQRVLRDFPDATDVEGALLRERVAERYAPLLKQHGVDLQVVGE